MSNIARETDRKALTLLKRLTLSNPVDDPIVGSLQGIESLLQDGTPNAQTRQRICQLAAGAEALLTQIPRSEQDQTVRTCVLQVRLLVDTARQHA